MSAPTPLNPSTFFKCMSDDTRLKSLLLLYLHKELCVCDLMTALNESQPKVSRHLAELRACGLVQDERRGKWVYYRLHQQLPDWARKVLQLTAKEHRSSWLAAAVERLTEPEAGCC
jgi:ArsR family transcriptional regulator